MTLRKLYRTFFYCGIVFFTLSIICAVNKYYLTSMLLAMGNVYFMVNAMLMQREYLRRLVANDTVWKVAGNATTKAYDYDQGTKN